jgi:hypothetical protein
MRRKNFELKAVPIMDADIYKTKLEKLNADYSKITGQSFSHTVRPIHSSEINFQGTITDKQLLLCQEYGGIAWAVIVFIKTSQSVHAVLLPLLDEHGADDKFFGFLKDKNQTIDVVLMNFDQAHFKLVRATKIIWPKNGILYPD